MNRSSRDKADAVQQVQDRFKAGDRLMCRKNGKTYQMGTKRGTFEFWMLCEDDNQRGVVDARVIVREFTKMEQL